MSRAVVSPTAFGRPSPVVALNLDDTPRVNRDTHWMHAAAAAQSQPPVASMLNQPAQAEAPPCTPTGALGHVVPQPAAQQHAAPQAADSPMPAQGPVVDLGAAFAAEAGTGVAGQGNVSVSPELLDFLRSVHQELGQVVRTNDFYMHAGIILCQNGVRCA